MKAKLRANVLLGLISLCGGLTASTASTAGAQNAAPPAACDVPAYLLATESRLPKVAGVIKDGKPLEILVVGSGSTRIPSSEGGSYPARLQAILKEKLPSLQIRVSVEILRKKTAEEAAAGFVKLIEGKKPALVIWQTGTVDAIQSIDPDDFRSALTNGVVALKKAGADVVLMNLQYSPRTETMISASPYLDNLRVVAQEQDVPLFDRFAIMHQWNDQGIFDLFNSSPGPELAKQVHDCLGRALAELVINAAAVAPVQRQN